MTKNLTVFTTPSKNSSNFADTSKNVTDVSTASKVTSDFVLNSAFESGSTWDDSTVDWDSSTVSWDGADGVSPLGDKDSTDFSSSSKVKTDFSEV